MSNEQFLLFKILNLIIRSFYLRMYKASFNLIPVLKQENKIISVSNVLYKKAFPLAKIAKSASLVDNVIRAEEFVLDGLKNGVEHCVAIEQKTGRLLGQAVGNDTAVKLCRVPKGKKYVTIHGHPMQKIEGGKYTPNFSQEDFMALTDNENMMEIWIMDSLGNINKIKKTAESARFKKSDFINYFNDELNSFEYGLSVPNFWQKFCDRFNFIYQEGFSSKIRF